MYGGDPGGAPLFVNGQPTKNSYGRDPEPSGKEPRTPRRMKGKWDESSVEQDMFIIEKTKKILDSPEYVTVKDKGNHLKKNVKRELKTLGWAYKNIATFKANFPFRNKYLVLDLPILKDDLLDLHRIKITMSDNRISDYKLMKWVPQ